VVPLLCLLFLYLGHTPHLKAKSTLLLPTFRRMASDTKFVTKVLVGLGAVTAAAVIAVAQIKQQQEEREKQKQKHQNELAEALTRPSIRELRSRAFLELIPYLTNKRPKGFQAQLFEDRKLTAPTGTWKPLPPKLAYECMSFLTIPEAVKCKSVCKSWRDFVDPLLADRAFLKRSAFAGFGTYSKAVRGRCWFLLAECKTPSATDIEKYSLLLESKSASSEDIGRDGDRTLIHHKDFESDQIAVATLVKLLNAYSVADDEVGYTQGMNFVAGFLLTKLPLHEAYHLLDVIMRSSPRYRIRSLYVKDLPGLKLSQFQFARLFEWYMPKLAQHFAKHNITTDLFLPEWFMTLFTYRAFPPEMSARIWDWFLADGWKVLHRVALAVLKTSEQTLMEFEFEGMIQYLKLFPDQGVFQPDQLLATARSFKVTNRLLHRLTQLFNQQLQ